MSCSSLNPIQCNEEFHKLCMEDNDQFVKRGYILGSQSMAADLALYELKIASISFGALA